MTSRANITDIIEGVGGVAVDARVTVVAVAEIHNLTLATRNGAEVSDTLKLSPNESRRRSSMPASTSRKPACSPVVRGSQIAGRFTMIPTTPFPHTAEWNSLISTIKNTLRLHRHQPRKPAEAH